MVKEAPSSVHFWTCRGLNGATLRVRMHETATAAWSCTADSGGDSPVGGEENQRERDVHSAVCAGELVWLKGPVI